jgi:hypothetical protein
MSPKIFLSAKCYTYIKPIWPLNSLGNYTRCSITLQKALWEYNGSKQSYEYIRNARGIFRAALRSDTGIGEIAGQSVIDITESRQKIREELDMLQNKMGILPEN